MPRIVWNSDPAQQPLHLPIELHYGSPNEFLGDFAACLDSESIFLPTDRPPGAGEKRELLVEIGFIGRTLHFKCVVEEVTTVSEARRAGRPPGVRLRLGGLDGPLGVDLRKLVVQLRQGLAFEAARVAESATGERLSPEKQLRGMPTTLKLMLALKADPKERAALANDPDPQVVQYLLKNPRLTLDEVRALAGRTNLNHQHLMTIAARPSWVGDEQVKLNLARNPRLPDVLVESLLGSLSVAQLRVVAGSTSTSPKARRVANRLLYEKGA